ncbi:MAG: adenylyl-sulfate kinase [Arenicellales bacterium]
MSNTTPHPSEADQLDRLLALSRLESTDLIAQASSPTALAWQDESDQFAVYLYWCSPVSMLPERSYRLIGGGIVANAQITDLTYRIEPGVNTKIAAKTLQQEQMAYCKLSIDRAIGFSPSSDDAVLVLTDESGQAALGFAVVHFSLRRATNVVWQPTTVDKKTRSALTGQKPCVVWLTGLSGAGKSTVADTLEQKLHAAGRMTFLLDGDNVRHGLCRDLGFTDADRVENIRRVAEVAKLMAEAGLIVITSFISPFASERKMARDLIGTDEFIEVYVEAPLAVCEARDPKGLYKKARSGALKNFTGIDSAYEAPQNAELVLRTAELDPEASAEDIWAYLKKHQFIG